jgi:hypothetical protein
MPEYVTEYGGKAYSTLVSVVRRLKSDDAPTASVIALRHTASTSNNAYRGDHARRLEAHWRTPFRATSSATARLTRRVPIGCSGVAAQGQGR